MAASGASSKLLTLNIGGTRFTCLRSTLTHAPGSMLAAMFSGAMQCTNLCDAAGHPFIDRNPKHFGGILDFLRCGSVAAPDSRAGRQELRQEAEYYGLEGLLAELGAVDAEWAQRQRLQDQHLTATAALEAARAAVLAEANQQQQAAAAAAVAATREQMAAYRQQAGELAAADHAAMAADAQQLQPLPPLAEQERQEANRGRQAASRQLVADLPPLLGKFEAAVTLRSQAQALRLAALGINQPSQHGQAEARADMRQQARRIEDQLRNVGVHVPALVDDWGAADGSDSDEEGEQRDARAGGGGGGGGAAGPIPLRAGIGRHAAALVAAMRRDAGGGLGGGGIGRGIFNGGGGIGGGIFNEGGGGGVGAFQRAQDMLPARMFELPGGERALLGGAGARHGGDPFAGAGDLPDLFGRMPPPGLLEDDAQPLGGGGRGRGGGFPPRHNGQRGLGGGDIAGGGGDDNEPPPLGDDSDEEGEGQGFQYHRGGAGRYFRRHPGGEQALHGGGAVAAGGAGAAGGGGGQGGHGVPPPLVGPDDDDVIA